MSELTVKKFLDADGVTYLASLLNDYPDNDVLSTVIDAISDALDEKQAFISTSGILKGDGTGTITQAVAGTDFATTTEVVAISGDTMTGDLTLANDGAGGNTPSLKFSYDNNTVGLRVTGATLSGGVPSSFFAGFDTPVKLSGIAIPSATSDAANKKYVDDAVSGLLVPVSSVNSQTGAVVLTASDVSAVAISGSTMTGDLNFSQSRGIQLNYGNDTFVRLSMHGYNGVSSCYVPVIKFDKPTIITNISNPTENLNVANKQYVDNKVLNITFPVASINSKTGTVILTASDIGAIPSTAAAASISTSDISAWNAKSNFSGSYADLTDKPSAADIGALPSSTTFVSSFNGISGAISYTAPVASVNSQTGNVILNAVSVGAIPSTAAAANITSNDITNWNNKLSSFTETDPTVPTWAKATNKPTYTASEVGAIPSTAAAAGISTTDISNWNAKSNFSGSYSDLTNIPTDIATTSYVATAIASLGTVLNYKGTKTAISALPASGNSAGDVWIVTANDTEYIWDGTDWEAFGPTIDLSGYATTSSIPTAVSSLTNDAGYLTSSDLPSWSQASTKPSYTASEVGALSSSTTYVSSFNGSAGAITYTAPVASVNSKTGAVVLTASDVSAIPSTAAAASISTSSISYWNSKSNMEIFEITPRTTGFTSIKTAYNSGKLLILAAPNGIKIPLTKVDGTGSSITKFTFSWVNDSHQKVTYQVDSTVGWSTETTATAYVQQDTTINSKALSSNITLTATDVGALPDSTTFVSSFNGVAGAVTYTPPVVSVNSQTGTVVLTASSVGAIPSTAAAATISTTDIAIWNAKPDIFEATFGTTNYSDTLAAYNAGKLIYCNKNNNRVFLSYFSSSIFYFNFVRTNLDLRQYKLTSSGWVEVSETVAGLNDRVSALENLNWVTYYSGTANPASSLGNNGDVYFQALEG